MQIRPILEKGKSSCQSPYASPWTGVTSIVKWLPAGWMAEVRFPVGAETFLFCHCIQTSRHPRAPLQRVLGAGGSEILSVVLTPSGAEVCNAWNCLLAFCTHLHDAVHRHRCCFFKFFLQFTHACYRWQWRIYSRWCSAYYETHRHVDINCITLLLLRGLGPLTCSLKN
jgi:hypothetical protein